jgi:LemA protein
MKRTGLIVLLGGVVLLAFMAVGWYNNAVSGEEEVKKQWSNVENAYQLRADKTKNLVEIVKGSADFEKSTLTAVIEARAKATGITLQADDLTPENIATFEKAQAQLSGALSRLLVAVEQYPQLQTTAAFRDLQAQYEGMENRIGVERNKYNDVARVFNASLRRFPGALLNAIFGFEQKGYFNAQPGAEKAPDIQFK